MNVSVQLFAVARQLAGRDAVELKLADNATIGDMRRQLQSSCPEIAPIVDRLMFARNSTYVDDATAIQPGAEIACIPPVSGG